MGMTTGLIDDFTEELLFEDELASKTVHDVLVVLHGILKYTATFFTGGFPAIEINYPKPGKKEMRVLSREEQTLRWNGAAAISFGGCLVFYSRYSVVDSAMRARCRTLVRQVILTYCCRKSGYRFRQPPFA